jgi:hypothetical protein
VTGDTTDPPDLPLDVERHGADDLNMAGMTGVLNRSDRADDARDATTGGIEASEATGTEMATGPFPRQFGARLVTARRAARRPLWVMATRSKGEFTLRDLRDAEAGLLPLDAATVVRLAQLYDVRIREMLDPSRPELSRPGIEIGDGSITAGGVTVDYRPGDARSMVESYFRLVRTLRSAGAATTSETTVTVSERSAVVEVDAPIAGRTDDLRAMIDHLTAIDGSGHVDGSSREARYVETVLMMATAERRVAVGGLISSAVELDLVDGVDRVAPTVGDVIDVTHRVGVEDTP